MPPVPPVPVSMADGIEDRAAYPGEVPIADRYPFATDVPVYDEGVAVPGRPT